MLRNLLTQLGGKYVHDVLINSPTFHKIVRKTHDTVKGIKSAPHDYDPHSTSLTPKLKKFVSIYKEEFIDNFKGKNK